MLKERTFTIAIHEDGSYTIKSGDETKGERCVDQLQHLHFILGGKVIGEGFTDNYFDDEQDVSVDIHNLLK